MWGTVSFGSKTQYRFMGPSEKVSLACMTDWNSMSIYIILDPHPLSRVDKSLCLPSLSRPQKAFNNMCTLTAVSGPDCFEWKQMWLLVSQCSSLDGGSWTDPHHNGPLCHVALLKHPVPIGRHLNSLPVPNGLCYSSTVCFCGTHCKEK